MIATYQAPENVLVIEPNPQRGEGDRFRDATGCTPSARNVHQTCTRSVFADLHLVVWKRDARTCQVKSGEGGIRTLGTVARTPVFETGPRPAEAGDSTSTSDNHDSQFARRFAQASSPPSEDRPLVTRPADPDLVRVCGAWAVLSAPIRHAILALVDSATRGG
jgi:hypothetical protein